MFCEISMKDSVAAVNPVENCKQNGYQELRAKQKEAILMFMRGRDVFVTLPTGCGKLLCYSILPGTFDSSVPSQ